MRLASVHASSAQLVPDDGVRGHSPDDLPLAPHPDAGAIRREARALARFILGREVEPAFVERYVQAHQHLPLTGDADERAIVAFAVAHPRLLPSMEAAAALVRPNGLLHRKAILMLAILEAAPNYADEFLPRRVGWMELALVTAGAAVGSAARVALGVPLLVAARARR